MLGLASDDRTQCNDGINVLVLEEFLGGHGDLEASRDLDLLGYLDSEEFCFSLGPLHHEHGDLVIELCHYRSDLVFLHFITYI